MKWEQVTVLLTLVCGLVSTLCGLVPAIGSMIVAIYTVRFQGGQELKRSELTQKWQEKEREQQRTAAVEDRNISRKWLLSDRKIEEKKSYLLAHKRFIDDYIANLLVLTSRAYMRGIGFKEDTIGEMKTPYILSLEQTAEIYHHIEAFGSTELRQQFQSLMVTVDEYLVPVVREPDKNQEKIGNLLGIIAGATAPVARTMENIIAEELQPRDWM